MTRDLVSVVIPTFNRAYCVGTAIESVLGQSYQPVEVLVVDDGSTDATGALIAERFGNDRRVRYIPQANTGVVGARNRGLREARGRYVGLLDSDDTWLPWKLELQVSCLSAIPEAGMVWTDMAAVGKGGQLIAPKYLRTMYQAYRRLPDYSFLQNSRPVHDIAPALANVLGDARLYWGDIFSHMIFGNLVHTSTVLLTSERLAQVGEFDPSLRVSGEDYDFHLRTCRAGPVAFADVASIRYQVDMPDQLTHSRHLAQMALNFLATVDRTLAADRDRIRASPQEIRRLRADANGWVGREMVLTGRRAEARHYLYRSLRLRYTLREQLFMVLSLLPHAWLQSLIQTRHRLRGRPRIGPADQDSVA